MRASIWEAITTFPRTSRLYSSGCTHGPEQSWASIAAPGLTVSLEQTPRFSFQMINEQIFGFYCLNLLLQMSRSCFTSSFSKLFYTIKVDFFPLMGVSSVCSAAARSSVFVISIPVELEESVNLRQIAQRTCRKSQMWRLPGRQFFV